MIIHDLAKQQEFSLPGAVLVAYFEKWFPVYIIDCQIAVRDEREVGIVAEFVLKLIHERIVSEDEMVRFLGIPLSEVQKAIQELDMLGYIHVIPTATGRSYKVSSRGLDALEMNKIVKQREESFTLKMDALTGKLHHPYALESVAVHSDDERSVIRAFLNPPDKTELARRHTEIKKAYAEYSRITRKSAVSDFDDILHIGSSYTQYKKMSLLIFRTEANSFRFQVFDRQYYAPEYEQPLGELVAKGFDLWTMDPIDEVTAVPSDEEVARLLRRLPVHRTDGRPDENSESVERTDHSVYPLTTTDHFAKLQDAFRSAKREVIIVSPWVTREVTDDLEEDMKQFLDRGGTIRIGYGYPRDQDHKRLQTERTVDRLKRTLQSDRFHAIRLGDTHEKILLCDERFVVVGSYNWLSFRGDRKRGFTAETSVYVDNPMVVSDIKQRVLRRMNERKKG